MACANLGGPPPEASYVAIISRFVVLSGLLSFPYRVQWSGLNATTTWDNVTAQSNFQDLADGGLTRGGAGGDPHGSAFHDSPPPRMTFNPGTPPPSARPPRPHRTTTPLHPTPHTTPLPAS